jgi:hypothetical protein
VHVERNAGHGADPAEGLGQVADLEDGAHQGDPGWRVGVAGLRNRSTRPSRPDGQNAIKTITNAA